MIVSVKSLCYAIDLINVFGWFCDGQMPFITVVLFSKVNVANVTTYFKIKTKSYEFYKYSKYGFLLSPINWERVFGLEIDHKKA